MRPIAASILWLCLSLPSVAQVPDEPVLSDALLPRYPRIAQTAHITGDIRVSFRVDRAGSVTDIEYISGPPLLRAATEENIRSWKFEPSNSGADSTKLETMFRYRISEGCPETPDDRKTLTVTLRTFHQIEIVATAVCTEDPAEMRPSKKKKGAE